MAIPIVNSIISWLLKKRIHQIDLFLKYPIDVQTELLNRLLFDSKNTEFGKEYNFETIKNYKEFSNKVPIRNYESFSPFIERSRKGEQNIY